MADTDGLKVERIVAIGKDPAATQHNAWPQVGTDGTLYVASSFEGLALDARSLAVEQPWQLAGPITGLRIPLDGRRLYLGLPEWISLLDVPTGREQGMLAVPGVKRIAHVGRAPIQVAGS